MSLNPKQIRFAKEYLVDLNATQAAIRAGYSKKTAYSAGGRLLKNVEVQQLIAKGREKVEEKAEISAAYVLNNLKEVAERCMQRAPVMVRQGREMVQLQDEEGRDVWQFDSAGANRSLELLGKHLVLFTDKVDQTVRQPEPIVYVPFPKGKSKKVRHA